MSQVYEQLPGKPTILIAGAVSEGSEQAMTVSAVERLEKKVAKNTIEDACESLGLNYAELAAALGVDRRTLLRYRKQKSVPSARVRARMEKIREIEHLLDEIFGDHDAALEWLYSPAPILQMNRGIDLIRRGDREKVLSVLVGLHSGAYT
jgi:putative toxin-antitoxin system antitoxin component (TIGR02293 family)